MTGIQLAFQGTAMPELPDALQVQMDEFAKSPVPMGSPFPFARGQRGIEKGDQSCGLIKFESH